MKKQNKLSIVTFNAQGVKSSKGHTLYRLKKTGVLLNRSDIDIINLQEIFTYKQVRILQSGLIHFPFCTYEKGILGPRGGLVTFSRKRLRNSFYTSYPYPFSLLVNLVRNGWVRVILRNMLSGKGILISEISGLPVSVINTHLVANPTHNWSQTNQFCTVYLSCIHELSKTLNSIGNHKTLIISGDFNIPRQSFLYRQMISCSKANDVFGNFRRPTFHKEFLPKKEKGKRLDYLMVKTSKAKFKVAGKKHIFTRKLISEKNNHGFLSDHMGLEATIVFND